MKKKQTVITDEEYNVICRVFEKLNASRLKNCGGVLALLNTWSFVRLFKNTPIIIQILTKAEVIAGLDEKTAIAEFIETYSNACEVLGYIAEYSNIIDIADDFFSEIEVKGLENDKTIWKK